MNYNLKLISKWRTQVMGFAALWIYTYHNWYTIFQDIPVLGKLENIFINFGYLGTDMFFMLSGLGVVFSLSKNSTLKFYKSRILRVMPAFIIINVFIWRLLDYDFIRFLKNITFVNFYMESIYATLWYIPAIMTLYLFSPLYYHFFEKARYKLLMTISSVMTVEILSLIFEDYIREDMFKFISRIAIFLIGIYIGWCIKYKDVKINKKLVPILIALLSINLVLLYEQIFNGITSHLLIIQIYPRIITVTLTLLMVMFFEKLENKKIFKNCTNKILLFFGTVSLEFYCCQEYVRDIFSYKLENLNLPTIIIDVILLVITIVITLIIKEAVKALFYEKKTESQ